MYLFMVLLYFLLDNVLCIIVCSLNDNEIAFQYHHHHCHENCFDRFYKKILNKVGDFMSVSNCFTVSSLCRLWKMCIVALRFASKSSIILLLFVRFSMMSVLACVCAIPSQEHDSSYQIYLCYAWWRLILLHYSSPVVYLFSAYS